MGDQIPGLTKYATHYKLPPENVEEFKKYLLSKGFKLNDDLCIKDTKSKKVFELSGHCYEAHKTLMVVVYPKRRLEGLLSSLEESE